jgi:hypothetical protein
MFYKLLLRFCIHHLFNFLILCYFWILHSTLVNVSGCLIFRICLRYRLTNTWSLIFYYCTDDISSLMSNTKNYLYCNTRLSCIVHPLQNLWHWNLSSLCMLFDPGRILANKITFCHSLLLAGRERQLTHPNLLFWASPRSYTIWPPFEYPIRHSVISHYFNMTLPVSALLQHGLYSHASLHYLRT